jgi:ribosomal-protein-alanine N-acetyltransferase
MPDPAAVYLREADPDDGDELARLTAGHATSGRNADQWRAWIADAATIVLVAEASGAGIVGFLDVRHAADEAEIIDLWVSPPLRRAGIARALLDRLAYGLASRGAVRLFLEVAVDNAPARALYTSHGFEDVARREAYYTRPSGERVDALLMVRDTDASKRDHRRE